MGRCTSPMENHRSPKRTKKSPEPTEMDQVPENIADIVSEGDAILVLSGLLTAPNTSSIGLRVSSSALSMASPTFKAAFAFAATQAVQAHSDVPSPKIIPVPEDDGDAMYILCNILHLRNDHLPKAILPELLCKVASLAQKYQCVVAAGRATTQFFDRLHASKAPGDLWKIIEAAYMLDEARYFARFTARWVLQEPLPYKRKPVATSAETQKLAVVLSMRHAECEIILHKDLDKLVDNCMFIFSKQGKHYIDWAPGMNPDTTETHDGNPPVECRVDSDGAAEYLGALRDKQIWPSTTWEDVQKNGGQIGNVVEKLHAFREPEYNDLDKCECCHGIKIEFTEELEKTKDRQRDRLWGLCLDCYKAGGVNQGECRYDHAKALQVQPGELSINGL